MGARQTFTIRGSRNGSQVRITWSDGQLSGDPPTTDLLRVEAELVAMYPGDRQSWAHVADPESSMPADPLTDPDAAWRLMVSVLDKVTTGEGDLPPSAARVLQKGREG